MKKFAVISHTHWDREWYLPFSVFRLKLVDLIDRLLCLLEKDPEFVFHLDAQTVVLEDYLSLRPESEALLRHYIAAGNIRVGPWYLQNDFFLTDGEATIRNLMIGTELAERFGKCGRVGYAPDQFGNISQLPQILAGFGIHAFVFGRGFKLFETASGVRREKKLPAEFEWIGADGTKCLAVHLKHWYNNAQHIPREKELAKLLLEINEKCFDGANASPYILLMNGVDHLEAQEDVREIIGELRSEGIDIEQTSLDEYAENVRAAAEGKLPVFRGALDKGGDYDILKGCWSSRSYLKTMNVRAQDLLINRLEPLYSYLEESGFQGAYPKGELAYLWKELLKNHPHDSICGCSRDETNRHMEDSYERIFEMGEELLERGLKILSAHGNNPLADEKNYSITVFNGTERTRSGVAEAEIKFLCSDGVSDFALTDEAGNRIPYELVTRREGQLDVFSPLNLPGVLDVAFTRIRFSAEYIPPYTAKTYAVVPTEKGERLVPSPFSRGIQNEFYALSIERGRLYLLDKRTGMRFADPFTLEDAADRGDAYVYRAAAEKPLILTPSHFEGKREGALESSLTAVFSYVCPARYDFSGDCRDKAEVKNEMKLTVTLLKGSPVISLSYRLENRACDHRIRLVVDGGFTGGRLFTDSPFDVAERFSRENCDETDADTHHNSSFVQLTEGERSLTAYTEGQHETERKGGGLAFTLLRATGVINRHAETFQPVGGSCWSVPENQVLRAIVGRMGVEFSKPKSGADCFSEGKFFRNGFICRADSFDPKKYSGGRFAVQAAELEQLYYLKDKYAGHTVSAAPLFECDLKEIAVTCRKRAERGGTLVRFVNLSEETVKKEIRFRGKMYVSSVSEREETFAGEWEAELVFSPKQIVTVRFSDV